MSANNRLILLGAYLITCRSQRHQLPQQKPWFHPPILIRSALLIHPCSPLYCTGPEEGCAREVRQALHRQRQQQQRRPRQLAVRDVRNARLPPQTPGHRRAQEPCGQAAVATQQPACRWARAGHHLEHRLPPQPHDGGKGVCVVVYLVLIPAHIWSHPEQRDSAQRQQDQPTTSLTTMDRCRLSRMSGACPCVPFSCVCSLRITVADLLTP